MSSTSSVLTSGTLSPPSTTIQKFGNQKTSVSDVGLGAHEGKYTPSSSVPGLATRYFSSLSMFDLIHFGFRFANLSVGISNETSNIMSNQITSNNASYSQHTYANQYLSSSYTLDQTAVCYCCCIIKFI